MTTTTPRRPLDSVAEITGADLATLRHIADECDAILPDLRRMVDELGPIVERARAVMFTPYERTHLDDLVDEVDETLDYVTGRLEVAKLLDALGVDI